MVFNIHTNISVQQKNVALWPDIHFTPVCWSVQSKLAAVKLHTSACSGRKNNQAIHLESRQPGEHVTLDQCWFKAIIAVL
jgi:hypothetical protein